MDRLVDVVLGIVDEESHEYNIGLQRRRRMLEHGQLLARAEPGYSGVHHLHSRSDAHGVQLLFKLGGVGLIVVDTQPERERVAPHQNSASTSRFWNRELFRATE